MERENTMVMQSEGKDAQGRSYDQVTKGGSSSAATLGAGGTGDIGAMPGQGPIAHGASAGNAQSARTDDLLSGGLESEQLGFNPGEEAGELQTGMGGIGSLSTGNAGSRQSADHAEAGGQRPRK
jgi:hypothetical protein